MANGRIDTHQHMVPPDYRTYIEDAGKSPTGGALPDWSATGALDMMGANGIATAVLSVSTPGVNLGDDAQARLWARKVNEFGADLVRDNPSSFGFFATTPLPDVDGALAEVEYALDVLGADGVVLLAHHGDFYLGDEAFEPLFAELGRRGAVVFVHPSELAAEPVPGVPPFCADYLLDTSRAALKLAMSGTLDRYPDLNVILSHGGGFIPYIADRVALLVDPSVLRRFWFDLALSDGHSALPSLLGFADPTHLTYGSDYPFAPSPAVDAFRTSYEGYPLSDDVRHAIDRGNAEALFPRLASVG